ncbi:hypothetical protein CORC01_04371 [Colletotrichum orchidophilum]|uniref:Uncharacterized protein n=1 Tax=Colletotrichum orchidophilum TaxID=1209926 RepID=A0A1G4BFW5_9PEZI|nr:uncharacterized protein CORC01_04371 [Colletotrichum orchidophilum]OHF00390.1 hypothetical protein CORC01_04371 [Colletotrichum orchidophilum]
MLPYFFPSSVLPSPVTLFFFFRVCFLYRSRSWSI